MTFATVSVPIELPGAIVPPLVTVPLIVPLPPRMPPERIESGPMPVSIVRSPLTARRPLVTEALVVNVPVPVSVQSVPCMSSVSKPRNFAIELGPHALQHEVVGADPALDVAGEDRTGAEIQRMGGGAGEGDRTARPGTFDGAGVGHRRGA